jgi:hypothetical protein
MNEPEGEVVMPQFSIRYQVHSQNGEHVAGPTEEVVTAANSAEAKRIIQARYYGMSVTILGISGPF